MAQDRLDRKGFARKVADRITRAGGRPSTVFGLAGPWGAGKTSTVNMITEKLEKEHSGNWCVASFTPWSTVDTVALTAEFYSAIATAMPPTEAGEKAKKLLFSAAPVVGAVAKKFGEAVVDKVLTPGAGRAMTEAATDKLSDQLGAVKPADPDPFSVRFAQISRAVAAANTNILVVVDDIDRLHTDELLSVMKAVRLLGRFDRVHYLLAYDEQTILDVLANSDLAHGNRSRARDYLEKIIQYPFVLPPIQFHHIRRELREQLESIAAVHGVPDARIDVDVDYMLSLVPQAEELTLRRINRWITQVDIMMALIGSAGADFTDAALITFLRLYLPELHRQIPQWKGELLKTRPQAGPAEERQQRERWLVTVAEALGDRAVDPLVVQAYKLLSTLFPRLPRPSGLYTTPRAGRFQVRERDYFDRYFRYMLSEGDIAESEIRSELRELIYYGRWSTPSPMQGSLNDRGRRILARRKVEQHLDVLAGATAQQAAAAAHLLTSVIPDRVALLVDSWAQIVYVALGAAISKSEPDDAERIVAAYEEKFGTRTTIDILCDPVRYEGLLDPAKIVSATRGVRAEALEICRTDLTREVPESEWETSTIPSVINCFDDAMWQELQSFVQEQVDSGSVTILDVAARFVVVMGSLDRDDETVKPRWRFLAEDFKRVAPVEIWSTDGANEPDFDYYSRSIASRRAYASGQIRKLLGHS